MEREAYESVIIGAIVVVGVVLVLLIGVFLLTGSVFSGPSEDVSARGVLHSIAEVKDEVEVILLVGFIVTTAYIMAKRSLVGEERVMVHRELTKEGDELKISYQILNKSTFTLRKVTLEVRTPQDVEIIQGSNTIDVGDIERDEARNVVMTVRPKHFTTGTVTATMGYFHNKWRQVPIRAVSLGVLYPFIEPVGTEEAEGIYATVGGMNIERQVFRFEVTPQTMFNALIGRLQTATPIQLYVAISNGVFAGQGVWVGRDPQSQHTVCIIAETKDYPGIKGGEVELTVYSVVDSLTSHYLTELHRTIHAREEEPMKRDYLRELAGRAQRYSF